MKRNVIVSHCDQWRAVNPSVTTDNMIFSFPVKMSKYKYVNGVFIAGLFYLITVTDFDTNLAEAHSFSSKLHFPPFFHDQINQIALKCEPHDNMHTRDVHFVCTLSSMGLEIFCLMAVWQQVTQEM